MGVLGALAGTITQGQRKSSDIASARKVVAMDPKIINISADVAPLQVLIKKLGNVKTWGRADYTHMEDDMLPTVVTTSTSYLSTDTTITVTSTHAARLTVGTILKSLRTTELLRVTGVNTGTDAITVTRGAAATTAAALNSAEELQILGFSDTEGNTSPESVTSEPTIKTNYMQCMRTAVEMSGRDLNSENYGEDEWARAWKLAAEAHALKYEKSYLFNNGVQSTNPTITGGVEYFVTTNVTNVAGALTEPVLIDSFMRPLFRRNYSQSSVFVMAGELFCRALDGFGRDQIRYDPADTVAGIAIGRYRSSFGEIKIIRHGLMTDGSAVTPANTGWQGYAMGLNMSRVGERIYKGRGNMKRENIQTPDKDGKKSEILSDKGFWIASELQHCIFKGITG